MLNLGLAVAQGDLRGRLGGKLGRLGDVCVGQGWGQRTKMDIQNSFWRNNL